MTPADHPTKNDTGRNYTILFLGIIAYGLIGLLVFQIFNWKGTGPPVEGGLSGALKSTGYAIMRLQSYVAIMTGIAIILACTSWFFGFKNLRDGFFVGALVSIWLLLILA